MPDVGHLKGRAGLLAPTGKRFEYSEAAVFTFSDGLISDVWVLGDIHGLTPQLSIDAT